MPTQPSLNLIPTIQQAIMSLLLTYEPVFLQFGYTLFISFATILIAWHGIHMMFSHDGLGEQMFEFAKLLLFISFGYSFIAFYESPLPGVGVSFSNLITDPVPRLIVQQQATKNGLFGLNGMRRNSQMIEGRV